MPLVDTIWSYYQTAYLIVFYGWPIILLFFLFLAKMLWKTWPVDVVIIEKRGSNLIKTNDRAGKFTDPYTGITGYKLQKSKDTIPVVNYDWVLHNVAKHTVLLERLINLIRGNTGTLFLFRYGSKQYKPIVVKENLKKQIVYQEIKDKKGNPVHVKIYQQFDPRNKLGALEFEVVDWDNMNFMVQEQRASMVRRVKRGEYMKQVLIPLGIVVMSALVCIIMFKFSYDWAVGMRISGGASTPSPTPDATTPDIPIISDLIPGG